MGTEAIVCCACVPESTCMFYISAICEQPGVSLQLSLVQQTILWQQEPLPTLKQPHLCCICSADASVLVLRLLQAKLHQPRRHRMRR